MRRAVRWAFGQQRPSIIARCLCSFLRLCFPLSLSLPLPRQTSLYETVHPILFPVSDRPFVVRTSLSADDEMASKKRKGERTSGRARRVSHSSLSLSLSLCLPYQAEQSRQIQTSYGIWIISKRHCSRPTDTAASFVMDADGRTDGRALLCCAVLPHDPFPAAAESGVSALFAICSFDLHM